LNTELLSSHGVTPPLFLPMQELEFIFFYLNEFYFVIL
jgi:hypothetical protein